VIGALVQELRPKQWTKNLLLFAGVLFARHAGDASLVGRAAVGFVAFSLLAGTVYLVNDLRDVEQDRLHPKKRHRPIASGRLSPGAARASAVVLAAIVVALSAWLGPQFSIVVGAYLLMNLAYTLWLRNQVLIDVFVIALGFVLRAIAGVELLRPVAETELSPWLLVCTFFGALFLALAKRRRELANAGGDLTGRRPVLRQYTPELLQGLLLVSAAASIMSYALYTIWPDTVRKFNTHLLLYTVPFVTYGIFRYLYLVRDSEVTEDPSQVLLTDRPLLACVLLYLVAAVAILYSQG
jgi:4-hydroxybenzoate polyprenyltransferase